MLGLNWDALASWIHRIGPDVLFTVLLVSVAIIVGCALASWIAPSEKKDRLFHRQVL